MQQSVVADEKGEPVWSEETTGADITEAYNRFYDALGSEDPETVEFRKEAARRGFERVEWAE